MPMLGEIDRAHAALTEQANDAVLADVATEIVPFGAGGSGIRGGIEQALQILFGFANVFADHLTNIYGEIAFGLTNADERPQSSPRSSKVPT